MSQTKGELAIQAMLGPITVCRTTNATSIEPFWMLFMVGMLLMNMVDNKIHHDTNVTVVGCLGRQGMELIGGC